MKRKTGTDLNIRQSTYQTTNVRKGHVYINNRQYYRSSCNIYWQLLVMLYLFQLIILTAQAAHIPVTGLKTGNSNSENSNIIGSSSSLSAISGGGAGGSSSSGDGSLLAHSGASNSGEQIKKPTLSRSFSDTLLLKSSSSSSLSSSLASSSASSSSSLLSSSRPYFDDVGPRNVTAIVGQSTTLKCRVKHLGNRTVSWMRKRDLHILTSSVITYTGDGRFSVKHPMDTDDWDLKIDFVQKRDAGVYECQVNTEPKISLPIMLTVEDAFPLAATHPGPSTSNPPPDAQANIWGSQEVFVKKGSTISLTCSVNVHSNPPSSVLWYHGHAVVDFDSPRGGISLETEKTESGTTSKLLVTKAALSDSGNYTCVPSNAHAASVSVHVLNGEHPAAMQTSSSGIPSTHILLILTISASISTILRSIIHR